jgi:putative ABC transport system permease protein
MAFAKLLNGWRGDVRHAWRALLHTPRHVATAVICLGLGLTVTVTVISLLTSLFYGDMPGIQQRVALVRIFIGYDRAAGVQNMGRGQGRVAAESLSLADYESLARDPGPPLESLAAQGNLRVAVSNGATTSSAVASFVSPDFFRTIRTIAHRGRLLSPADERRDAPPALVLGYHLWRDRLGADEAVVGAPIDVGGRTFVVVGIAPPRFTGIQRADKAESPLDNPQIWIPLRHIATWVNAPDPERPWIDVVGRRHEWASIDDARMALMPAAARRAGERPDIRGGAEYRARRHGFGPEETPLDVWIAIGALLSVPLTVLAIACANVANLQLARATARTRELAVRQALGASRGQIVRLLSIEAALLASAAALAGWAGASAAVRVVQSWFPVFISLDWRVLVFALVLVGGVTMLSGVAPALIATRRAAATGLRHSAQGGGMPHARLRHTLVMVQIAASFVLLAGSQLFVRMASTIRADLPPAVREQLVASFDLGMLGYGAPDTARVMDALELRLRTRPDVAAVSFTRHLRAGFSSSASAEPGNLRSTAVTEVTPAFAAVTSARVLSGRWLEAGDSPRAVVVNERLARQIADDGNVVGRQISLRMSAAGCQPAAARAECPLEPVDVIGVIESQPRSADDVQPDSLLYRLLPAARPAVFNLHVRTADPAALADDFRRVLREVDPRVPSTSVSLAADLYVGDFDFMRVMALAVGGFGALALVVAAAGLHAVMAYIVSLRRREFGIRLAIGARTSDLLSLVGRVALRLLAGGLLLGLLIAVPLAFVFRALLVGVSLDLLDPWAWMPVVALLGAVTVFAAFLPARRAAAVNPVDVLRAE